jgi:transcriptional regulator with XRE-family HTH domain
MQRARIDLGRRIHELRKARGWSQEKLGEMADLHPTYIGGIERGERNVSFDNLVRIASAFDLSLSQFFDFQKGGHSARDTLRASVLAMLRKRDEAELRLFLKMIVVVDEWRESSER